MLIKLSFLEQQSHAQNEMKTKLINKTNKLKRNDPLRVFKIIGWQQLNSDKKKKKIQGRHLISKTTKPVFPLDGNVNARRLPKIKVKIEKKKKKTNVEWRIKIIKNFVKTRRRKLRILNPPLRQLRFLKSIFFFFSFTYPKFHFL